MDFVEELFGISPDGGSGATEFMVLVAIAAAIFVSVLAIRPAWRERIRRAFKQHSTHS
jgi:hypothetical protein